MATWVRGNAVVLAIALGVIWFVVLLQIVMVVLFADAPAVAWSGLAIPAVVALGLSIGAGVLLRHERPEHGLSPDERAPRTAGTHCVLVIANETLSGESLREEILSRAEGKAAAVLVVAPILAAPVQHWTDEEDEARIEARRRLDVISANLGEGGIRVRAEPGSDDPLVAIEDALRRFGADEIIIATHPAGRSNWLEDGVVDRVREFYDLPIIQVVVDVEEDRERWLPRQGSG